MFRNRSRMVRSITLIVLILFELVTIGNARVYPIIPPGKCSEWNYDDLSTWPTVECTSENQCAGSIQSPVYIRSWVDHDNSLPRLYFTNYDATENLEMSNNGHTVDCKYRNGQYKHDETTFLFSVDHFHFHSYAEEVIQGKGDIGSLHIVHYAYPAESPNKVAISVIGILLMLSPTDADNELLAPIFNEMHRIPRMGDSVENISFRGFQDYFDSLEESNQGSYWNLVGSLTTPPCTEFIDWTIMHEHMPISLRQYMALNKTVDRMVHGYNERPIQRYLENVSFFNATLHLNPISPLLQGTLTKRLLNSLLDSLITDYLGLDILIGIAAIYIAGLIGYYGFSMQLAPH